MRSVRALSISMARGTSRDPLALLVLLVVPLVVMAFLAGQLDLNAAAAGSAVAGNVAASVSTVSCAFAGVFTAAMNLVTWRENGMLGVLRGAPVRGTVLICSALVVTFAICLVQCVLVNALAATPVVGASLSSLWPDVLIGEILGSVIFFGFGWIIGSLAPSASSASAVSGIFVFAMAYLSGAVVPVSMLPSWAQAASNWMPMKYVMALMESAWMGTSVSVGVVEALAAAFGISVVLIALIVRLVRWS